MLADDAADVHYFSCLEFLTFFFCGTLNPHEFMNSSAKSTLGREFDGRFFLSTPPEGSESFISEMVESEVWKSDVDFVVGKGDMGFDTQNFDRWSRQFWKILEMVGCIFWEIQSFLHVEVIRLTFVGSRRNWAFDQPT